MDICRSADKMPNPIKEFFEKKKAQAKFKVAGPGQKLGDAASAERDSAARRRADAEASARHRAAAGQAGSSRSAAQQQGGDSIEKYLARVSA